MDPNPSLLELRVRRDMVREQLREEDRWRRNRKKHAQRKARRRQEVRPDTTYTRSAALTLMMLEGSSAEVAAAWLFTRKRRRRTVSHDPDELHESKRIVQDWFLGTSSEALAALVFPEVLSDERRLRAMYTFLADWKLADWVVRGNYEKSAVVRAARLLEAWEKILGEMPPRYRPCSRRPYSVLGFANRSWMRRWRRRQGGRIGALRCREHQPVDELRNKACLPISFARQSCAIHTRHGCPSFLTSCGQHIPEPVAAFFRNPWFRF